MRTDYSDRHTRPGSPWYRPHRVATPATGCANYVGRVGALALALGIGVAVTTAGPGVATASPAASGSSSATSSQDTGSSATGSSKRGSTAKKTSTTKSDSASGSDTAGSAPHVTTETDRGSATGHSRTAVDAASDATEKESDTAETQRETTSATSATVSTDTPQPADGAATPAVASTAPAAATTVAVTTVKAAATQTTSAAATAATPFRPIRALVAGVLTVFGYNPLATPSPGDPTPNPILVGIWGLYRRIESFIANETPTVGTPTVSSTLNAQGQITGSLNATDFDGDTLTYTVTQGQHGTAIVNADGTFTYTPVAGYTGADTFSVNISDDSNFHFHFHLFDLFHPTWHSTTETVNVVVPQVAPVITVVSGPSAPAADGSVRGTFTVVDLNRDPVTVAVASGAEPVHGAVEFSYNTTSGIYTWTYRPSQAEQIALGLNGSTLTDGFTISATDGHTDPVTAAVQNVTVAPAHLSIDVPIELGTNPGTSNVTVNAAGTRAYISDSAHATVTVVDLTTGTVQTTYHVGDYPVGVATGANGVIYVSNSDGHSISVINTTTGQATEIAVADAPGVPVLAPGGKRLYVPVADGTVAVIDTTTNTQVSTINYAGGRIAFAGADSSKLYAMGLDELAVIDVATGTVLDTIETPDRAYDLAVNADGTRAYVAAFGNRSVQVVDTSDPTNLTELTVINIPPAPANFLNEPVAVTLSPDSSLAYVGTLGGKVFVVDTATNTLITGATQQLPGKTDGLAVSLDGLHLYSVNAQHQTLAVITLKPGVDVNESPVISVVSVPSTPAADGSVSGSFRVTDPDGDAVTVTVGMPSDGAVAVHYNATSGVYSWTYTPTEAARLGSGLGATAASDAFTVTASDANSTPGTLDISGITIAPTHLTVEAAIGAVTGKPSAVALSPDGSKAYVADKTHDSVAVVDLATGEILHTYTVGDAPSSIAVHADGRVYVGYNGGVNVINPTSGAVKTLAIGDGVTQVIVSPDGTRVYATKVGNISPGIVVINTATDTIATTFGYPGSHLAFAGNDSSTIYATDFNGFAIAVLKASDGSLLGLTYVINKPGPLVVNTASTRAYVTTATAIKVYDVSDPSNMSVVQTIALPSAPDAIALNPDGTLAYLTSKDTGRITVVDLTDGTVLATGTTLAGSHSGFVLSTDGTHLYATNTTTRKLSVLELNPGANTNQAPVVTEVLAPTTPTATGVINGSYVVADPDGDPITVTNDVEPGKGSFLVDYDPVLGVYNWQYSPTQASQLISGLGATPSTDGFSINATDGANPTVAVVNLTVPQIHFEAATPITTTGSPGGVFVSPDGTRAYVTDAGPSAGDPNTVKVVNLGTGAIEAQYTVGDAPQSVVATTGGDTIYVANAGSGSVSIIETGSGTVTNVDVGGQPGTLVLTADAQRLYVTTDNGGIKVIDAGTKAVVGTEAINLGSTDIALSADGSLLYSLNRDATISIVDTATGTVTLQKPANTVVAVTCRLALSPDGQHLYATYFYPGSSKIAVYDAKTLALTTTISLSSLPNPIAVSPDGSLVYVGGANGGLAVIDAATNTVIGSSPDVNSNSIADVVASSDGQHVYVVDTAHDTVIDLVVTPGSGSLLT
ncbi:Ig-like domain-containing protein [Mycobacterium sp. DL592]|uniref:Ig-like domain-containing protein n=1 Tax=Mycobacterium sp. DL592 TaxID=2675524 RepID=UPI0014214555|nr:Ig-like domain-containing protein [Mycobacterium sp. DL592]